MEVYVLDSLLRRTAVFDVFESMIWTERFADAGDFELHIPSTFDTRSQFANGVRIAINESYRVMTVETVEDTTDADGKAMLKITGHSLEYLLKDRNSVENLSNSLADSPTWDTTDTPGNIARTMVYIRAVQGYTSPDDVAGLDKIPYLGVSEADGTGENPVSLGVDFSINNTWMWQAITVDDLLTPGTLPEPATEITWHQDILSDIFKGVQDICNLYDLGFRILRNFDNSQLVFNIYTGSDRTTRQTDLPSVVFASNLENLQNTTEFQTIEQSKNVAYVYCDIRQGVNRDGAGWPVVVVYGSGVDASVDGFDRRVLSVDARSMVDPSMSDTEINTQLQIAGEQALNQNRTMAYFDGEINQNGSYKYGVDYQMGDLVELRNVDGVVTYKRVTEQIFVSDSQGERSYPTLSMDSFIGLNTWLSFGNKPTVWLDYDSDVLAWEDM